MALRGKGATDINTGPLSCSRTSDQDLSHLLLTNIISQFLGAGNLGLTSSALGFSQAIVEIPGVC